MKLFFFFVMQAVKLLKEKVNRLCINILREKLLIGGILGSKNLQSWVLISKKHF